MTGTIDDLRSTFAGHADNLTDAGLAGRSAAVATRVAQVRKRRRAAVGGCLAAVVAAAVIGVTALPRHHGVQPAGAPERVDVYGFGYRLDHTIPVESGRLNVHLPASDRDYAVVLVGTGLGSGDASMYVDDQPAERVVAGDEVSAAFPVDATAPTHLQVRLSGAPADAEASVAVYRRTDEMPAGLVHDGRIYRQQVGSATLLGGAFGDPGQAALTYSFDAPGHWGLTEECTTPAKHAWLHVVIDGRPAWGRSCEQIGNGRLLPDAGNGIGGFASARAGHHTVRLYVTATQTSTTPVRVSGTQISGAAYDDSDARLIDHFRVDRVTEFAGREWKVSRIVPVPHGAGSVSERITTGDQPARVSFLGRSAPRTTITTGVHDTGHPFDQPATGFEDSTGLPAMGDDMLMVPHGTYVVSMKAGRHGAELSGALIIYRPVD